MDLDRELWPTCETGSLNTTPRKLSHDDAVIAAGRSRADAPRRPVRVLPKSKCLHALPTGRIGERARGGL